MAESFDCAPAKLSPVKKRRFQPFKKAYPEKWPFVTVDEKGDTSVNSEVHSTVVKRLDWRTVNHDQQNKSFQLCRINKGEAQCRLPYDFPIKSGSQIFFINVGICLLMCS